MASEPTKRTRTPRPRQLRLENGAHAHRVEQGARPRLSAGRDDGTRRVRRRDLPAAGRRAADPVGEPDDLGDPRVVGRSRRDAAVDAVSRNVATTGAPLRAAVAAGVLSFGTYHGGDVEACMDLLDAGLAWCAKATAIRTRRGTWCGGRSTPASACRALGIACTRTTRVRLKLLQMAYELDLEGEHIRLMRVVDTALAEALGADHPPYPCERRWRDRSHLRRPRAGSRIRQRALHHLARARPHRPCARREAARAADAADRPEESRIRRPAGAATAADEEVGRWVRGSVGRSVGGLQSRLLLGKAWLG